MENIACSTCPKLPEDLNEETIICSFVCVCNAVPFKSQKGSQLKQKCVDTGLDWMRDEGQGLNIIPEVGYYMGTNPPTALMEQSNEADKDKLPKRIKHIRHMTNHIVKHYKNGKKYEKYDLRIPDVTVVVDATKPPHTHDNLKHIYEIKFPGDQWQPGQKDDYETIAGSAKKLTELTPNRCGCGDKSEEEGTARNTWPVLEAAWEEEKKQLGRQAVILDALDLLLLGGGKFVKKPLVKLMKMFNKPTPVPVF